MPVRNAGDVLRARGGGKRAKKALGAAESDPAETRHAENRSVTPHFLERNSQVLLLELNCHEVGSLKCSCRGRNFDDKMDKILILMCVRSSPLFLHRNTYYVVRF